MTLHKYEIDLDNTWRLDESLVCPSIPNIGGKLDIFQLQIDKHTRSRDLGEHAEDDSKSEEPLKDESREPPSDEGTTEKALIE